MEFTGTTELSDAVFSDINFQDSLDYTAPSSDLYIDDDALGKLLAEVHRDDADYRRAEGVSVSPSSVSVMVDRTGEPVERSDSDHFGFSVRNVKSAQNQFLVITQAERMVDRTGEPVEGNRKLVLVHRTRKPRVPVAFLVQAPCGLSDCLFEASFDRRQRGSTVAVASEPARPGSPLPARLGCWSHGFVYRVFSDSVHRRVIVAFSHLLNHDLWRFWLGLLRAGMYAWHEYLPRMCTCCLITLTSLWHPRMERTTSWNLK